jgi:flagellar motor protein MotB
MVATIQFSNGSSRLNARDRRILRDVSALQHQGGAKVTVIGHASQRTRDMDTDRHSRVNQKISQDRADAVSRELIRLGVAADSIQVSAVSDSRPLYYEYMPTGEAGNRRTEVYLGG